jgi:hypothetical protein
MNGREMGATGVRSGNELFRAALSSLVTSPLTPFCSFVVEHRLAVGYDNLNQRAIELGH